MAHSPPPCTGLAFAGGSPTSWMAWPLQGAFVTVACSMRDTVNHRIASRSRPGPVLRQPVELTNDARRKVPPTLICCSIPSAQVLELARTGHPMFTEVAHRSSIVFSERGRVPSALQVPSTR